MQVVKILRSAFPSAIAKRETKGKREMYYVGIENRNAVDSAPLETQLETSLEVQLRQECFSNKRLKTRVDELEQQLQSIQQANIVDEFKHEFSLLMSECDMLSFGPDSLEHLQSFSLSGIIHEIQTNAPKLFSFFCDLGDTDRNIVDGMTTTHEEIKTLTSLCTLTNARSRELRGCSSF